MSDTFYRATLRLERVEPYTEDDSILDRGTEIAYIALTGDSPAEAMEQIYDHAETLYVWHRTKADDRAARDQSAPLTTQQVAGRIRAVFNALQPHEQAIRAETQQLLDELTAKMRAEQAADPRRQTEETDLTASADDEGDEDLIGNLTALQNAAEAGELTFADADEHADDDLGRASANLLAEKPARPQGGIVVTGLDPLIHCHVPVGGGYCHRPYGHTGACSTSSSEPPAEAGQPTEYTEYEGAQQQ